jgi:alpha-ketoglutaric semialdehyde dehydrogenase
MTLTTGADTVHALLIGGERKTVADHHVRHSPRNRHEVVGRVSVADRRDVEAAVEAAHRAQPAWNGLGSVARAGILREASSVLRDHADDLAPLLAREEGKTLAEARGEVARAVDNLLYHAGDLWAAAGEMFDSGAPGEEIQVIRSPLGVVGIITPWNFPVAIPARKIAPALAYGNTVVWKPSTEASVTGLAMAELLTEAGLPPGVFNVVTGGDEVGAALADADLDGLSFTGSTAVGFSLRGKLAARGVAVQLEMGGNSAAVVFADADLEVAVRDIVDGAMISTGQRCTATRRIIAHADVYSELRERLIEAVRELRVGDPLHPDTDVGPLVSFEARDAVLGAVEAARAEGWRVLTGGGAPEGAECSDGAYFEPTLLADGPLDAAICREEVFGPVSTLICAADDDQAMALVNDSRYGLSAAGFTASQAQARRFRDEAMVGVVHINGPTVGAEPNVPFGGWRDSGSEAPPEMGKTAREFFTRVKTVYVRSPGYPA